MTSEPDAVSTLGYHWTDYTGTTLDDAITKWPPSGNPKLLMYIIGTHWNITGDTGTLGCHWNHTGWCLHQVSQSRSSDNLHNWNTLEHHWSHKCSWDATGTTQADASTQACPSRNHEVICIIGTRWNTTGTAPEDHWGHTGSTLATSNNLSSGVPVYTGV